MPLKLYPEHKKVKGKKNPVTWVLVADAREARICVRGRNHGLLIPVGGVLKAESVEREQGRHALGRVYESKGAARHMVEPTVDIKQETRQRFIHQVTEKLEEAWEHQAFDRLVLIGPPKVIGDLRKNMPDEVKQTVIAEVGKELTHAPLQALTLYLANHGLL